MQYDAFYLTFHVLYTAVYSWLTRHDFAICILVNFQIHSIVFVIKYEQFKCMELNMCVLISGVLFSRFNGGFLTWNLQRMKQSTIS